MSFHTVSEELRLGTDTQTLLRTFTHVRDATDGRPREEVFAVIELPDRPAQGDELIQAVFDALRELAFTSHEEDPYVRFELALKEVNAIVGEYRDALPNKHFGRINAVIGLMAGKDLHLTQAGEAEAYLVRKGLLTTVTEGLTPEGAANVDTFVNIASGRVENHDKLVLATERLLRYATKSELTKIFSPHKEIGLALEELDEIIVLEGAQTTGIFAFDIVTPAAAARVATEPAFDFGRGNEALAFAGKHISRGVSFIRDQLPEGTRLPSGVASIPGLSKLNIDKNYVILGFLVVVILVIASVSVSMGSTARAMKLEEVKQTLTTVQESIDIAKLRRNIGDKATAYAKLDEAEKLAQDLVTSGVAMEEATTKITEIKTLRDELDNVRRFTDLKATADIGAKTPTLSLVGLVDYHGRTIAYDAHNAYDVTGGTVAAPTVIDAQSAIKSAKYFADRDALIFLTADGKVIEWRDGAPTIMDTDDTTWKTGIDVATYSSFAYVLDPINNQIWKYTRKRDNYGGATGYSTNTDLTKAVSITIDGDIWVLAADADGDMKNDIIRIRKGEKRVLNIKDLPTDVWQTPAKIFTDENLKYVYVLDKTAKRILRFYKDPPDAGVENKQLIYNTQYFFEGLDDVRDFWVDSAEQKMFVVDKNKLYEVAI